jgi:hypothetical protein
MQAAITYDSTASPDSLDDIHPSPRGSTPGETRHEETPTHPPRERKGEWG